MSEETKNKIRSQITGSLQEQLEEVRSRIFLIDMIDRWSNEDKAYWEFYKNLEKEIEDKILKAGEKSEEDTTSSREV